MSDQPMSKDRNREGFYGRDKHIVPLDGCPGTFALFSSLKSYRCPIAKKDLS